MREPLENELLQHARALRAVLEASERSFRENLTASMFAPTKMAATGFDDGSRREGLAVGYFRKQGSPHPSWQDMPVIQAMFHAQDVHGQACRQHSGGANGYVADFLRFVDDEAYVAVLSNFAFAPILRCSLEVAAILAAGNNVATPALGDEVRITEHDAEFVM